MSTVGLAEGFGRQCYLKAPPCKTDPHWICFILFCNARFFSIAQAGLDLYLSAPASRVLAWQACAIMLMNSNGQMRVSACMSDFSVAVIKNTTMKSNLYRVSRGLWLQRDKSSPWQKGVAECERVREKSFDCKHKTGEQTGSETRL